MDRARTRTLAKHPGNATVAKLTTEQPTPQVDTQAELPETIEPTPSEPPPKQNRTKPPAALKRIQSDLNGISWQCDLTHRPRRYRNSMITQWNSKGDLQNSWDNTKPVDTEATQENIGQ